MQLPVEAVLSGYVGSRAPGRDTETLWAALPQLRREAPQVRRLIGGGRGHAAPDGVEHLAYPPDVAVPRLLSALDLAIVTATTGRFGLGSYAAIPCGVPMVCADLPNLRWIAGERARYYRPGDPRSLAQAVLAQLREPLPVAPLPDWSASALELERALTRQYR